MRKLLLLFAMALVLGTISAPTAGAASQLPEGSAKAYVADVATYMEAQGWITDLSAPAPVLPTVTSMVDHEDGTWTGSKGYYHQANQRTYRLWAKLTTVHKDVNDEWSPQFTVWCRRTYGTKTVDNNCNFDVAAFQALLFDSGTSEPPVSDGTANPPNSDCVTASFYPGQYRTTLTFQPWKMAYLGYLQARFLTDACADVHLTSVYSVGSYRVAYATHAVNFDENRTGMG